MATKGVSSIRLSTVFSDRAEGTAHTHFDCYRFCSKWVWVPTHVLICSTD